MKNEAYILEIHHGGNWSKRKRMSEYIDGKLNYYHGIVDGKTSLRELFGIVRGIIDIGSKEFKVFCGCPQDVGCSLGVFELRNELDLIQMFYAYEGLHTIQLFIEVVDEHVEEIQQEEDQLESDVESIQSQCYDSDNLLPIGSDSGGEKINYKVVHLNHDPKEVPELAVGIGFGSAADFRHAVRQNARYGGYDVITPRNDGDKVQFKCRKCDWSIYAAWDAGEQMIVVRTYNNVHECERVEENFTVGSTWIAHRFMEIIRADPSIKKEMMKSILSEELDVTVSDHKINRARRKAIELIEGMEREQYHRLKDYVSEVGQSNPGTYIDFLTEERNSENDPLYFKRLFICPGACVKGFYDGCRPFLGLDGCHITNGLPGVILSAMGVDANGGMFPVAYAVVENESKSSSTWFLEHLQSAMGGLGDKGITFISDRQKGLVQTFEQVLPHVEHRFCIRHLFKNMITAGLRGPKLQEKVHAAAKVGTEQEFLDLMEEIKGINFRAWEYLETTTNRDHWCRHRFPLGSKSDMVSNNICESFNSWILKARDKTIINLMNIIRRLITRRLSSKKANFLRWKQEVCPAILNKIAKRRKGASSFGVLDCVDGKYEVTIGNESMVVDIEARTCSCYLWQLSGIPCKHGIAAILRKGGKIEAYVDNIYKKGAYRRAYKESLFPIRDARFWPKNQVQGYLLEPPIWRRKPGRPRKKRKRGEDEKLEILQPNIVKRGDKEVMTIKGKPQRCHNCWEFNHNTRSCKNPKINKPREQVVRPPKPPSTRQLETRGRGRGVGGRSRGVSGRVG